MSKRLIKRDPLTGKETWCHMGEDGQLVFETTQNVDALLKSNREQHNDYRKNSLIGNTQKHNQKVAEIPETLYYQLIEKLGKPKDNPKGWKQWLNESDNRLFRTGGGNI